MSETTQEKLGLAGMLGVGLLMAIGVIVGGTVLHGHFAAKDALCNTVGGAMLQQQSTGAMAHCGLYGFLSGMGQIIQWGGTVGLIAAIALVGVAYWASREAG